MYTYAELVLHQISRVFMKLIEKRPRLFLGKMLKAPLQYPTTVGMGRQIIHVATESLHETQAFR